jgi:sporulation protein YlmC with PRC-barrel domain
MEYTSKKEKGKPMKNMNLVLASELLIVLGLVMQSGGAVLQADDHQPKPDATGSCSMACVGSDHPTAFNKASDLIGMKVRNQAGQSLGRIKDFVIDTQNEHVSYMVLSVRYGFLDLKQKLIAVPFDAFQASPSGTYLVLNANRDSLELARGFPATNWPSPTAPSWGAAPPWQEGKAIEPSAPKMQNLKPEITKPEKSNKVTPDLHEPGSLGYPGW